jgi:pimeloyl-ACP methyl ester carboxylesterase
MKPPILFIHGAFSSAAHFESWKTLFSQAGYQCHVPNLPGHGVGDSRELSVLTIEDYAAALRLILARFPEPPVIIGHSMGGLLAQQLAATSPCRALVCVASAPPWMLKPQLSSVPYFLPLMPAVLSGRTIHPPRVTLQALAIGDLPAAEQAALLPTFGAESGKAYRAMVFGSVRVPANAFRGPVLCLSGGKDRIVSQPTSDAIAQRYDAQHERFDHGHWLIAPSLTGEVGARALRWVDETVSAAR